MVPRFTPGYGRRESTRRHRLSPLRRIAVSTSLLAVAGIAVSVPTALPGLHPKLAARLAGMGEPGMVNQTVNAKGKRLCWTFDVPTKRSTGAAIHTGTKRT